MYVGKKNPIKKFQSKAYDNKSEVGEKLPTLNLLLSFPNVY